MSEQRPPAEIARRAGRDAVVALMLTGGWITAGWYFGGLVVFYAMSLPFGLAAYGMGCLWLAYTDKSRRPVLRFLDRCRRTLANEDAP